MQEPNLERFLLGLFSSLFSLSLSPAEINASKTFSGRRSCRSTKSPLRMFSTNAAGKAGSPPPGAKPIAVAVETAEATPASLAFEATPLALEVAPLALSETPVAQEVAPLVLGGTQPANVPARMGPTT